MLIPTCLMPVYYTLWPFCVVFENTLGSSTPASLMPHFWLLSFTTIGCLRVFLSPWFPCGCWNNLFPFGHLVNPVMRTLLSFAELCDKHDLPHSACFGYLQICHYALSFAPNLHFSKLSPFEQLVLVGPSQKGLFSDIYKLLNVPNGHLRQAPICLNGRRPLRKPCLCHSDRLFGLMWLRSPYTHSMRMLIKCCYSGTWLSPILKTFILHPRTTAGAALKSVDALLHIYWHCPLLLLYWKLEMHRCHFFNTTAPLYTPEIAALGGAALCNLGALVFAGGSPMNLSLSLLP